LRAIAEADKKGEVTGSSVSETVQLSAPTVSRILDRLESAGLILRERRSKDRRKVCLTLTPLARKQLKKLPTPLHEQFLARLKSLDQKHQELLLQSLDQLVEMMEATDIEAAPMLTTETVPQPLPTAK
jgi:DNA-binding MarR family transcriptional regulator